MPAALQRPRKANTFPCQLHLERQPGKWGLFLFYSWLSINNPTIIVCFCNGVSQTVSKATLTASTV